MNKVILLGRLGAAPEFKALKDKSVCTFNVATSEKWVKNGDNQERTEWHKVVVWDNLAEICNKYLAKGSQVLIEGKLQTRHFEDVSGQKRYITEIVAHSVQFLDSKSSEDGGLPL